MKHESHIELSVEWTSPEDVADPVALAWGRGMLLIDGEPIWFEESSDGEALAFEWTWIDLLEFLARSWNRILYEETYPLGVAPHRPIALRRAISYAFSDQELSDEDDADVFRFEENHDLARAMKGIHLPSVFVVRQTENVWISTESASSSHPKASVVRDLELIGDMICGRLMTHSSANQRTQNAIASWNQRAIISRRDFIKIRSGLGDLIDVVSSGIGDAFWDIAPSNDDSELLAVARFSGGRIGVKDQRYLLNQIRSIPRGQTQKLDDLSKIATALIADYKSEEPYQQGYRLAQWMRKVQDVVNGNGVVYPNTVLRRLNVTVLRMVVSPEGVEAIGCWGPYHGPAVLVNPNHSRPRRTTLAHELCHFLVDRTNALPMAEVLGGNTPNALEQRANAFSAEFIVPREAVAREVMDYEHEVDESFIHDVSRKYGASFQIVAHQLSNSSAMETLSASEKLVVMGFAKRH